MREYKAKTIYIFPTSMKREKNMEFIDEKIQATLDEYALNGYKFISLEKHDNSFLYTLIFEKEKDIIEKI